MSFLEQVVRWFATGTHWQGLDGIPHRLVEHLTMSGAAVAAAGLVAVPLALVLGHIGRGGTLATWVSNVGRAVPSFAILALAVQVAGIGARPAFVALVALAAPPMLTNTYVGVREVDPEVRESARGMGMTPLQVLLRVELPAALPLVMAGIRTAAVQVVATATLAALVAWGGLGRYIVDGFSRRDFVMVFAGALLVAVVSVLVEAGLAALQRLVTPPGLTAVSPGQNERVATGVPAGATSR